MALNCQQQLLFLYGRILLISQTWLALVEIESQKKWPLLKSVSSKVWFSEQKGLDLCHFISVINLFAKYCPSLFLFAEKLSYFISGVLVLG